jgi:rRNA maturation RNase YbeY
MASGARAVTVNVVARPGMAKHAPALRRTARAALRFLGEAPSELSIALVDDDEMRKLNAMWRGHDRPTDVLSFAQREGEAQPSTTLLGDVVISLPTATRQARQRRVPLRGELDELLIHGILHLLGYDHERSLADARRMFAKAREIKDSLAKPTRRAQPGARSRPRARRGTPRPR